MRPLGKYLIDAPLTSAPPTSPPPAGSTTAWQNGRLVVDAAGVARPPNIVLGRVNTDASV
ncbi:hypothetical protein [Phytohabitans aurantiacus]|uniref:Uncharacterized protein n=1 Tax=Phytohabitans aurantiacus TaxID=3016789 RepID=A0ABQ5R714_9ACTN|nr:hypothetical protein [Phytohabitans aurantiacus]GLI02460.1 hypothetical protein Pa4123_77380 [Phytohabitans aurantiacus]